MKISTFGFAVAVLTALARRAVVATGWPSGKPNTPSPSSAPTDERKVLYIGTTRCSLSSASINRQVTFHGYGACP